MATAEPQPDPQAERFVDPIRAARAYELAVEHTIDGIERERLRHGDRLPNEDALAAELGVSRPTVRQALRVLQEAGVLAVRRGGGGGIYLASDLIPAYGISSHVLEDESLVDVVTARRVIEGAITERATVVGTDADLDEVARTVDLLREHVGAHEEAGRADAMFHRAVVRAARSRTLERSMREVERLLAPVRRAYPPSAAEHERTLDVHRRQLAAMRARDLPAVRAVLDEHFRILEETVAARRGHTWEELFAPAR